MADKSDLCLFNDYFHECYGTNERVVLPRTNPFEKYDVAKILGLVSVTFYSRPGFISA